MASLGNARRIEPTLWRANGTGDGSLYTGIAKDLAARLRQHQAGRASRYTRARLPVTLVWWRETTNWSEALREQRRIKRLRRREKEMLVAPKAELSLPC